LEQSATTKEEAAMMFEREGKGGEDSDTVANLFLRAKQALSSPLYVVLRDSPV
jgi:hypothetical protein